MLAWLELDRGLEHLQRRRVGRRLGAAGLAKDALHLRHGLDHPAADLQQLGRPLRRQARQGRRHVEQIAFVKLRQELATQPSQRPQRRGQSRQRNQHRGLGPAQHPFQARPIDRDQRPRDRVLLLVGSAAADPIAHQHRNQGDRQAGGRRHGIGLREGQRAEQPPLLSLQREDRHEGQGDDQQREEQRRPDLLGRLRDDIPALLALQGLTRMGVLPSLQLLVRVLDHHHGRIHHRADGDCDAAQGHDVGVDALIAHHQKGRHHAQRQRDDGHQGGAQMPQEDGADDSHDQELLDQLARQVVDRALDQGTAVIGRDDLDALGQAALQLGQLGLHGGDRFLSVLARTQHHHAACDLALAVQFGDAPAHLGPHLHGGDIAQANRNIAPRDQGDGPEIVQRLEVAARAHHVLRARQLQHRAAALLVGAQQGLAHLALVQAVSRQLEGVEHDLVLLDHAADRRHFGNVGQALQFELEEPVLQRAQLGQVVLARPVHQRVLEDPAHARGIGPERRFRAGRQASLHLVQIFQHARTRPVQVRAIVEQHIDEGVAEEGKAAHGLGTRHRQHRGGQRIGHLVLDDLGRLARVAGADDHLHVGEVGQGIHRCAAHGPDAPGSQHQGRQQHQEAVGDRPSNQAGDHGDTPSTAVIT